MMQDLNVGSAHHPPTPKMVAAIIDRDQSLRLEDILRERHAHFHYMFNATGTASSEILNTFGLTDTKKIVCICMEPSFKAEHLMTAIRERMELNRPGRGIVFTLPISGISAIITHAFSSEITAHRERWVEHMEKEAESCNRDARFELVVAIVNQGFSEEVMEAARAKGARGGTIVHARRTGTEDSVKFFGISLQTEKEIVAIVTQKDHKRELMQAINRACGIKTEAHGIVISMPVESCAGIDFGQIDG